MEDIALDYGFFASIVEYFYYLVSISQSVTNKPLKTFYMILFYTKRFVFTNYRMYNCRLARLSGAFKNHIDLVLCIVGSD